MEMKGNHETIYEHCQLGEHNNYMLTYTEPSKRERTSIPRSPD
jgi:hypothetical protein